MTIRRLTMSVERSAVVTEGAPAVVWICAPGAVAVTGLDWVVCKGMFEGVAVDTAATDVGVSGAAVASVIVAVFTLLVSCASAPESKRNAAERTEYDLISAVGCDGRETSERP